MYQVSGVTVERIITDRQAILIEAVSRAATGLCPTCQQQSEQVHSRYHRSLADLPACGRPVRLRLMVRRFRCRVPTCPKQTFAEQIPAVTHPHRQRLVRLEQVLTAFGVALGGEAGARLIQQIGVTVSGSSLLRLARQNEAPPERVPRVLGVDDWAWRKGKRYGTVLVDLEQRRPVDLLPDRTAASLHRWLAAHPGVEVIVRDRSTEYARGATLGAPDAIQVLDRWHVLRNVREVAQRLLARSSRDLHHLADGAPLQGAPRRQSATEQARRHAERERAVTLHTEIRRLTDAGGSILGIARQLGLARSTVRKYRAAAVPPERARPHFPSGLDPYEDYLRQRWAEGCRNGLQLWRELQAQGYTGSSRRVSLWAQLRRTEPAPTTPPKRRLLQETSVPHATRTRRPSVPRLAWFLVADPTSLNADGHAWLARLQAACAPAATAYPLLQAITRMIRDQQADHLDAWLTEATRCGLPDITSFAAGLQRERAELLAALELPWSTGPVEGQITRLKLIKRQGYGRCRLDTLKRRFLQVA